MTEKEQIQGEIKILQAKLALLEEMENYKTPVEEAYKNIYGNYPMGEPFWIVFKKGYEAAQSTKEDTVWKSVALRFGKILCDILPCGYYEMTPDEWLEWVNNTYEKNADELVKLIRRKNKTKHFQPTPQSPEQVEEGLRDTMIQAKKDGVFDND